MARYRSARGKMIDMDKIKIAQETTIAVGNMKVNARGDKITASGSVVAGRNQIMDKIYAVDASPPFSPNDPNTFKQQQIAVEATKAKELHDLVNNLVPNASAEEAANIQNNVSARGTLAGSVAKPSVVNQQTSLSPQQQKKSQGPSRI
jgi:hypothetical protein